MGIKDVISQTSCFSKMNTHRPMTDDAGVAESDEEVRTCL